MESKKTFNRLQQILLSDKPVSGELLSALLSDLRAVCGDYFEFDKRAFKHNLGVSESGKHMFLLEIEIDRVKNLKAP
ncbi:MAG: hypothetical protein FWD49_04975 [Firmicutes bacterium]|nr:hypothetical protein [Bacillota bacterium]